MKKTILIIFYVLMISNAIFSTFSTGNLIVAVQSEEGRFLPGATITLSSASLMGSRTQDANVLGKAIFRNLPIGKYKIEAFLDGFQPGTLSNIEINLNKTTRTEIIMKLGQPREIINITSLFEDQDGRPYVLIKGNPDIQMPDKCIKDDLIPATANEGNLIVITTSAEGSIISGADVQIIFADLKTILETISDPSGKSIFNRIPAGEYSIEAKKTGNPTFREAGIRVIPGKTCTVIEVIKLIEIKTSLTGNEFDFMNYINNNPKFRKINIIPFLSSGIKLI